MQNDPRPRHVLAVNDEPALLAVYEELLTEEGFRMTTQCVPFAEPADVLALEPDLLIIDLMMGRLDWGATFLGMLRADPGTRGLPVVVCTSAAQAVGELEPQLEAWGVAVVLKPFDLDALVDVVRSKLNPGPGGRS